MEHPLPFAKYQLRPFILLFFLTSLCAACGHQTKNEDSDTKGLAEEHNKAKFEDADKTRDAQFLVDASVTNLTEIQLAKLAEEKGMCAEVKELGKMMERQHTDSQRELKTLAAHKIITLPDSTNEETRKAYQTLNGKAGREFDMAYCHMMVEGHKKTIESFEKEFQNAIDPEIKSMISSTLPVLRAHLEHSLTAQDKCDKSNKHRIKKST